MLLTVKERALGLNVHEALRFDRGMPEFKAYKLAAVKTVLGKPSKSQLQLEIS